MGAWPHTRPLHEDTHLSFFSRPRPPIFSLSLSFSSILSSYLFSFPPPSTLSPHFLVEQQAYLTRCQAPNRRLTLAKSGNTSSNGEFSIRSARFTPSSAGRIVPTITTGAADANVTWTVPVDILQNAVKYGFEVAVNILIWTLGKYSAALSPAQPVSSPEGWSIHM